MVPPDSVPAHVLSLSLSWGSLSSGAATVRTMREDVKLRKEHWMRLIHCVLATGLVVVVASGAPAQDKAAQDKATQEMYAAAATPALAPDQAQVQAQAVMQYWTAEAMASAQPMPFPTLHATDGVVTDGTKVLAPAPPGPATVVNGWRPGSGPYVERKRTFAPSEAQALGQSPQSFGVAPTDPLNGPYGPFQRWTMEGQYPVGGRGLHGKLFFTISGANYVCSATVIGRSTIATASHCVHEGGSSLWYANFLFCPSYYNGGPGGAGIPYPTRGCWSWNQAQTTIPWISVGDPDYDYACIVLATTGTVVANKVGNVTGWSGRAWNFADVPEMVFGYPQAAPFTGQIIEQVSAPDWYNWDPVAGGQVSKIIGDDMTGGCSGGGWFLGWAAPGAEFPDTDGSWGTDPTTAGPYINGVNSHKRCIQDCRTPPIASAGVFWQEMSSPPFRGGSATDDWESEDVFNLASCLGHPNNNP